MTQHAPAQHRPERSSNFFLGFLFLSKPRRRALSAVYAYCRTIDDIVDSGTLGREQAQKMLDFWREEIERLFAGKPTHSVSRELLAPIKTFRLPKEPFLEMIRGCSMDLGPVRMENFENLESYMHGVACSVGRLCVEIFGYQFTSRDNMAEFVKLYGYAFQLTNIIRDVGADLEMDRVYLPLSEMREAGYTMEALVRREHNPGFDRLMEFEYRRARGYYQRARNLVDFRDRPNLVAAEVMAHIYEAVLEEIHRTGYRVLFERASLPPWRKVGLALRAWLYCYGIHI